MPAPRVHARLIILGALLATAAVTAALTAGTAQAGPNVTGTWHVEFEGEFSGTCDGVIVQTGNEVVSVGDCSLVGTLTFRGTIDPTTGSAVLVDESLGAVLNVTAAPDGNSFSGAWSALGFSGTISGTRTSVEVDIIDISGDWTFFFAGREGPDRECSAVLTQDFTVLSAAVTCTSGTTTWTGSVSPISGSFDLQSQDKEFAVISAYAPLGDGGMLGSWRDMEGGGMLFAFPAGTSHGGALTATCTTESGYTDYCYAEPGETMTAVVALILPPSEGYDGFEVTLDIPGQVSYLPAEDPATEVPACDGAQRTIGDETVTFTCASGQAVDAITRLVEITLQCSEDPAYVFMSLGIDPYDSFFTQSGVQRPLLLAQSAPVECGGAFPNPGPVPYLPPEAFLAADVNCDGRPDSIDAALVLQQDAGLLATLPCGVSGDASMDGLTNSIDASVILQMSAGLVLPGPEPTLAPPLP